MHRRKLRDQLILLIGRHAPGGKRVLQILRQSIELMKTRIEIINISFHSSHYPQISKQTTVQHSPGALCTVDRSFGPILDHTFHHISDTHVCHHLFSKMPFYHAQEATECIRKVLGPYYMKDETPLIRALYRSYSACQFIEDDGDIVFYKNIK